jgi:hypothetical protein
MPVFYKIGGDGIIRTRCVGDVTLDEVIDHFRVLERDPDCPDRLDVLLDLTEMGSVPRSDQLRAVSREIGRIQDRVRFGACAIVACTDVLFGMSRMFEVFAQERFRETCVFRAVDEAEAWLHSERSSADTSSAGK